jgi:oligopeptide transport system ATP-binding protein
MKKALLEIRGLTVDYPGDAAVNRAVDGVNVSIGAAECLGMVGESGAGKSQTFLAALGLLGRNAIVRGSVRWQGEELLGASRARMNAIRGRAIAMVFQDALSGLTPNVRLGRQMEEVAMHHLGMTRAAARARALEMLDRVRIPAAAERLNAYPFELSGGMRQRAMIAIALICRPAILIADEPTTALDVTVQAEILRVLVQLRKHTGTAIVMITHDLGVIAGLCDRVQVMYAGRTVETGPTAALFQNPVHPYTRGLLASVPRLDDNPEMPMHMIPGQAPASTAGHRGCPFEPRCEVSLEHCRSQQPLLADTAADRACACHLATAP